MLTSVKGDNRPHITVDIFGVHLTCLLDSGASQSVIGKQGLQFLERIKAIRLEDTNEGSVVLANGESCHVSGSANLPVRFQDQVRVIKCLVVPSIDASIILGMNFWKSMNIVPTVIGGEHRSEVRVDTICDNDILSGQQRSILSQIVADNFSKMGTGLGCAKGVQHVIDTGDHSPIKQRYYAISPYMQAIMHKELDEMLELGVVRPSSSPWSSPVVLVKKSNGEYRFCVDYRQLNKVTKRDAYAIPYMAMILDRLRNSKYFSGIDLKSAYWQIPLSEASMEKTAFVVPGRGLFEFTRMPFGIHNAPARWQRFADTILGHDLEPYVFVYLDDIIVATPDFETHVRVLQTIFDRLLAAGVTVNRDKCEFGKSELKYLGYVVDHNGLRVDADKVSAVTQFPTPTNVKAIRRFVGLSAWYKRFIPNFSERIAPLTNLTKKNKKFVWDEATERSFLDLKQCLVTSPILTCPDFSRPFILQTDASQQALGAVLAQEFDEGERVIAYASRTLNHSEAKFCATELECLAVLWAIKKFRGYLEGAKFTVVTDHASLKWLANLKEVSGRLGRWVLQMQSYDFEIVHRSGKSHQVPDALSRAVPRLDLINVREEDCDAWYVRQRDKVIASPKNYPLWKAEGGKLFKYVACKVPQLDSNFEWKLVVPKGLRKVVLEENHDSTAAGHLGIFKTKCRIMQSYYWPSMSSDIVNYVRSCEVCQCQKPEQRAPAGLMGGRKISRPWQVVCTDLMGPWPTSSKQNRFLLVVADVFTKYTLFWPLRTASASAVRRHIEDDVFLVYGVPEFLLCDNGTQYVSKEFKDMLSSYGTELVLNPQYHSQSNPTERVNRVVKTMIKSYINDNQRSWDTNLAKLGFAVRTAVHEVTGYTPAYLNFGRELNLSGKPTSGRLRPEDLEQCEDPSNLASHLNDLSKVHAEVGERLKTAYRKSADRYNLRRRHVSFNKGDIVLKRNHVLSNQANYFSSKLAPKFIKCRVKERISTNVYLLADFQSGKTLGNYHVCDIKPYIERATP